VQKARAFVALITPESRNREWVLFEAGAAWGRGQLYSPLLVDTRPEDLSTTIAHYVATRADSREQVEILVRSIADTIGITVKPRFGQRYGAFQRHLEQRAEARRGDARPIAANASTMDRAVQLWFRGRKDEARELFEQALREPASVEVLAQTRLVRSSLETDTLTEFLSALERMDPETRATASYASWRTIVEDRPDLSLELIRKVMATPDALSNHSTSALPDLCQQLTMLGRTVEATTQLAGALKNTPPLSRPLLAERLLDCAPDLDSIAKLALVAVSTSGTGDAAKALLSSLTNLAIDEQWPALAVFAAQYYRRNADTGTARNSVGRAYATARLFSLAYDAYREAAAAGVSVAKTNIASNLAYHPVPAAGLVLLKEHQGEFDAATAGYPFRVRAELEDLVEDERKKGKQLEDAGRQLFWRIAALVEKSFSCRAADAAVATFTNPAGLQIELKLLWPFANLWTGSIGPQFCGLFTFDERGTCIGVEFDARNSESRGTSVELRQSAIQGIATETLDGNASVN